MGIVRDIGFTLPAMQEARLITCSAAFSTTTAANAGLTNTTADLIVSTGIPLVIGGTSTASNMAFGRVIDRLVAPFGAGYYAATPQAYFNSTVGSTEADRKIQIGVKLQHGDSSGGGDMVDYSTERQPALRTYFSSARTTDQLSWELSGRSTGGVFAVSNPCIYNLDAAKRYIRTVVFVGKDFVTTASGADEAARIGSSISFLSGDMLSSSVFSAGQPAFGGQGWVYSLERNSPESSSTSTA